jgi:hypothetical protein
LQIADGFNFSLDDSDTFEVVPFNSIPGNTDAVQEQGAMAIGTFTGKYLHITQGGSGDFHSLDMSTRRLKQSANGRASPSSFRTLPKPSSRKLARTDARQGPVLRPGSGGNAAGLNPVITLQTPARCKRLARRPVHRALHFRC